MEPKVIWSLQSFVRWTVIVVVFVSLQLGSSVCQAVRVAVYVPGSITLPSAFFPFQVADGPVPVPLKVAMPAMSIVQLMGLLELSEIELERSMLPPASGSMMVLLPLNLVILRAQGPVILKVSVFEAMM